MAQRLKFWGWGYENERLSAAEEGRLAAFYGERLGAGDAEHLPVPEVDDIALAPPRLAPPAALAAMCSSDPYERLLHTYGKSFPDTVRIFDKDFANAPDVVAYPRDDGGVAAILDWATSANAAVIPFGGGSSVVGGVEPAVGDGYAGTISLDVKRLDRVLEIDPMSRAARIQAGIMGPALEAALRPHDLTLRHFPQSFQFSTLGGWIATRSGGHFAMLYTHIDDFVESLRLVCPAGILESRRLPGSGAGPSPDRLAIGSEGALGVITEAWMRLQARPTFRARASVRFASFGAGAAAVRALSQSGLYPSNLRLLDPLEAEITGAGGGGQALLVLAFESADHPVEAWLERALVIAADHGGSADDDGAADEGGRESGAGAWREAFLRMPYYREYLTAIAVLNFTFETAITWQRFAPFHEAVMAAAADAIAEATGAPGLVTCRFTHVYPDGPAPYFTVHARGRHGALLEQWQHIKDRVSDAVIAGGGTITHHHAVGRDHMKWYARQRPQLFGTALTAAKAALDPTGILNPGVLAGGREA